MTPARVALGRAGGSVPTRDLLDFQLAHARARDAVQHPFDAEKLRQEIASLGVEAVIVRSAAADRAIYLRHPDLGRRLDPSAAEKLTRGVFDLAIVISDGLSALAAERQVVPLLRELLPLAKREGWAVAPLVIVPLGRVAIEDDIGARLGAQAAVILLGERPGLGSPDSLGAYVVYDPRPGKTDAERNCISNIRPEGLAPTAAAGRVHALLREALRWKISGVRLHLEEPGPVVKAR